MKFLRTLFLFNTLIVLTFFVLLFTSASKTSLTAEVTTEIPVQAAFKLLVKNLSGRAESSLNPEPVSITFTYFKNEHPVTLTYRLHLDEKNNQVFLQPQEEQNTLFALKEITHQISLKELVDGTTNIQWQIHYSVRGWSARLLNRFFWQPKLNAFLHDRINELRRSLAS